MSNVFGAICTYRRPTDLMVMLDALQDQTVRLDRLVVIDNDADPAVRQLVERHRITGSIPVETVSGHDNPGPAGAFALAFEHFSSMAADDDIFVIFDDDDPPPIDSLLEDLLAVTRESFRSEAVAGVGLRGGTLDLRTGIVRRSPTSPMERTEHADHLHGGWFPCYRFGALRTVGGFDPSYFWGFEELELGRRLTSAGYELLVASDVYFQIAPDRPARSFTRPLATPSWRHFYRHRNLVRVLRRDGAWSGLILTIAARLVLKPVAYLVVSPRLAMWHLRTNLDAIVQGMRSGPVMAKHGRHLPT